ncbi:hypothetical protein ACFWXK_28695 [Streptomyces sp. NPDC059070]|uniref:hypothetical protein n=1 Tax=unclassified Streptomyces TaxID=2593676 RepID=UPI0034E23485
MHEYGAARAVRAAAAVCAALLLLMGCRRAPADSAASRRPPPPPSAPDYGATFLGTGDCAAHGRAFTEVPCASERAVARVSVRRTGPRGRAVQCPARTDFVLYIDGDGGSGYACMRNLEPPHPGDPGMGGGPFTVVGDCVHRSGRDQVKETPCDGSGAAAPDFQVTKAVADRADCPSTTALYVQLTGGGPGVGCARRR